MGKLVADYLEFTWYPFGQYQKGQISQPRPALIQYLFLLVDARHQRFPSYVPRLLRSFVQRRLNRKLWTHRQYEATAVCLREGVREFSNVLC